MLVLYVGEVKNGPDTHQPIPAARRELCRVLDPMLVPYLGEINTGLGVLQPIPAA